MSSNMPQEEHLHVTEHEGFVITCSNRSWKFIIAKTEEFKDEFYSFGYDSLSEAKKAIDTALARTKRQKRVTKVTKVAILLSDGAEAVWKGLHAKTGNDLIEGHANYNGSMWPLNEGLRKLLKLRDHHVRQANALAKFLEPYKIDRSSTRMTETNYEEMVREKGRLIEMAQQKADRSDLTFDGKGFKIEV